MKTEFALMRASVETDPKSDSRPWRKSLRQVTDAQIHDALLTDSLPGLVGASAEVMLTVATILLVYGLDPQVNDFVEAAQASIESGRAVMDKGLLLQDHATTMCGAVMLEITCRGVCAALGVPYEKVLVEVHRAHVAGENPMVRQLLEAEGLVKPQAANDEATAP